MYEKRPPREIQELINFQESQRYEFDKIKFFNKVIDNLEKRKNQYKKNEDKIIQYEVGEKALLRNRELPKACLLYTSRCV